MFGMRKEKLAAAVAEPSNEYGPGSASYSPEQTPDLERFGFREDATQADDPNLSTSDAPIIHHQVPTPPDPAYGGMPGIAHGLGWSTGLLPSRAYRQPLDGRTLVVPSMGVHPAEGPVGVSNRQDRLATGVAALVNQWLPSQQTINESFVKPVSGRNRNPLDAD